MSSMDKKNKLFWIFSLIIIMCLPKINVKASDEFVEIPINQLDIQTTSQKEINTLSTPSLGVCELGIGIASNGIGVDFSTRATDIATEIGCKDIVLQEKTATGWKDIPIRDHYTYDSDDYAGAVVYLKAQVGKTYRVYCTHYAVIDDIEYTLYNITNSIVYN